jgi:mono/diheme cytochrome c family protein
MRRGIVTACIMACAVLMGAANGAWLQRVPAKDHQRVSPLPRDPETAQAGAQVFTTNCAKCHGNDAMGRGSRPALISNRVAKATDGDLYWIVTNGNAWKGMPPWQMLPDKQRWQVVAYLRALNANGIDSDSNPAAPGPAR